MVKEREYFLKSKHSIEKYDFRDIELKLEISSDISLEIMDKLRSGIVIIVKNVFGKNDIERIRTAAGLRISGEKNRKFNTELAKIENFHTFVDVDKTQSRGYKSKNYFNAYFRNKKSDWIYGMADPKWNVFRTIQMDAEEKLVYDETPEKIEVVFYPPGDGTISTHTDPDISVKMNIVFPLNDYQKQKSLSFLTKDYEKVYVDEYVDIGDAVLFYPSIFHCVDPVKETGRWSMVLSSYDFNSKKRAYSLEEWKDGKVEW